MTSNQIAYWNYLELARSNRAREAENYRSNLAKETETARSNRENEMIAYQNYLEAVRSHQAQESLGWGQLAETRRRNEVLNTLTFAQVEAETAKASEAWANQSWLQARTIQSQAETEKTIADTERIRMENEWIDIKNTADVVSKYGKTAGDLVNAAGQIVKWVVN